MKNLIVIFTLIFSSTFAAAQTPDFWNEAGLQESRECLLQIVRAQVYSDKATPAPALKLESSTPLADFQASMETWWEFKPDFFVNVYNADENTVYLTNQRARYKSPRTPVDSLVHELTHFVQSKDKGAHKGDNEEYYEEQAVRVQTWFRENRGQYIVNESYQGPCH